MKKYLILLTCLLSLVGAVYAYDAVFVIQGSPGVTLSETGSDSVQTLAASLSTDIMTKNGKTIVAVYISCETYAIRYTFGTNPTASFGHILYPGQSLYLTSTAAIRNFRYINDTSGQNAALTITAEY